MIIVTGGTGLTGSHLLYRLCREEDQPIRALVRSQKRTEMVRKVFRYYSPEEEAVRLWKKIEWVEGDLLDIPSLEELLEKDCELYHCAAIVSFQPGEKDGIMEVNAQGTANLVNAALAAGVRKMCHISSVAALTKDRNTPVITEDSQWKNSPDNSVYGLSKQLAEREVWRGIEEGMKAVIVQPGIILGPGFWNDGSGKIFKTVAGGFPFYTEGINAFVDVRDVVEVMSKLMKSDISAERFILSCGNFTYREVFERVAAELRVKPPSYRSPRWVLELFWRVEWLRAKLFGVRPLVTRETARSARNTFRYSNERIRKKIGFEFTPLEKSIRDFCSFYRSEFPSNS